MPMGPPPITSRWSGLSRRSKIVSLVWTVTSAIPSMGGTSGDDPVAMTNRRAAITVSPACTSVGEMKRPYSWITRTPSPSNRSTLSWGAMVAMTSATWFLATLKATSCPALARLPSASSALEGTQP